MSNKIKTVCEFCGKEFEKSVGHYNYNKKNGIKNYCSRECLNKSKQKRITKTCIMCGKQFEVTNSRKNNSFFCSQDCHHKYRNKKVKKICKLCGKEFYIKSSEENRNRGNYCCREHYYLSMKSNIIIEKGVFSEIKVVSKKYGSHIILVDTEDLKKLKNITCYIYKHHTGTFYAGMYEKELKKHIPLHRYLMNAPKGMVVDHINHNTLDNRKENLRICTNKENVQNMQLRKNNTSGFIFIRKSKTNKNKIWLFAIKDKLIASFNKLSEAIAYRNNYLKEHYPNIMIKETF